MAKHPTVAIVGCGRAGGSIGLALEREGHRVGAVWSRSRAGRQRAARLLEAPTLGRVADVVDTGDLVIVAVPDEAIEQTATEVAEAVRPGQVVVHTSGVTSVEALAPVRDAGARIGSMHPLQTLPDPRRGADALREAAVAVTCDERDRRMLHRLVSAWGGRPFPLRDDARVLYHAAAVLASNYVTALLGAADELMDAAGVPNGRALLAPLVRTAVDNTVAKGAERSITGPVVRGDLEAVRRHLVALRERGEILADAYGSLSLLTAQVARTDVDMVRRALK